MLHEIPIADFKTDDYNIQREIINTGAKLVQIRVLDPRLISTDQRRKARAIIGDIGRWCGHPPDYLHEFLKYDFATQNDIDYFSLSDTDMTTARHYISYLIDFCLYHDVPLKSPVLELCDDLEAAAYSCLVNKKCLVCGKKSQLHHVEHVQSGRNRKKIIHEGMLAQALCGELHHTECHTIGQQTFDKKYHTLAIPLDKYLCNKYGLGTYAD